ncbi:HAD-superfamily hydrolase subfamily IA variant 3 [Penicillium sp. DV-2018c]|nr:HAD-superfamily hydrolase subfamily IA variant 3 [Penicillium sp. DV-2018c]KAJ5567592.1 HAD-superfamily hydrolase subfamily IA variant 3 [Penicillium sp. DV-2018c]
MYSRLFSAQRVMSSAACKHLRPRKFAPLDPAKPSDAPPLKGIVFDVDGTLCLPQHHMFTEMREALGIDRSTDILEHIRGLPEGDRAAAVSIVQAVERRAMLDQQPQPGLLRLMDYLESRGLRRALCTRNFEAPVQNLIKNHLNGHVFLPIITRDTPNLLPKPDPAGILHIANEWGLPNAENLIMVGDSIDDMTAGHMAGAATVLLLNEKNVHLKEHLHTDICITQLDDLVGILEGGFLGTRENEPSAE